MKIATLLSGGVDSAVVVHLLCEQGFKPDLFYIKIGMDGDGELSCSAEEDIELCTATARKYGLHLDIIDLQKQYWEKVVGYVIDKVSKGLTPNPDVMCNRLIKFGCFEEEAGHLYDKTATGHYATVIERDNKVWLGTAVDPVKDQTDFLAQIDYLQMSKLMFPLGRLMKHDVRRIAAEAKLPSAMRRDSQGICFLGKINYNDFIRRFLGEKPGAVVELETGRKIGTHKGFWFHTLGQRKGLGLGGGPWFVVKKDIENNIVYVSKCQESMNVYSTEFFVRDFHAITENIWQGVDEADICFKIRHTDSFVRGRLRREGDLLHILSERPVQGVAPGQFGVLYDEHAEICVGSGEIAVP